jgi:hypothetical protein
MRAGAQEAISHQIKHPEPNNWQENPLMIMKVSCIQLLEKFLSACLLLAAVNAAQAQLTLDIPTRDVYQDFHSDDSHSGNYANTFPGASTNGLGLFSVNQVDSSPGWQTLVSATATCLQNSTISTSATSLSVTGQLQVSGSGSASQNQALESGSASWLDYSRVQISFTITQPFNYSLQANTTLLTNALALAPSAFVAFGHASTFLSNPDLALYGSSKIYHFAAPSTGGSNSGVLPAGAYAFRAECGESGGLDPSHSPTAENFAANFTLNVTIVPQPPVIMTLTPAGPGTFLLTWTAPQSGSYRVLSSTNLVDWSEYIAPATKSSGVNTNTVNLLPGSPQGFFRIQYLP